MKKRMVIAWLACVLSTVGALPSQAQQLAEQVNRGVVGVIAGSVDGTSMHAASDLAWVLDRGDELRVLPIQGKGSVQAITDLLYLRGIDIAIIQRDALEHSRRASLHPDIDSQIRYITKLFNEEIHIVARQEITSIDELSERQVNIGPPGSGSDLTATLMFEVMGLRVEASQLDHALALEKLKSGELAAMVYVGGQPDPLFEHISADEGLHLLPITYSPELLELYLPASMSGDTYPGLLKPGSRIDTLAVEAIMAVYNWPADHPRHAKVQRFVETLFANLDQLQQAPRHRKWQDVRLEAELAGWQRFGPAEQQVQNIAITTEQSLEEEFAKFLVERDLADVPENVRDALYPEFLNFLSKNSQRDANNPYTFALVPKAVNNSFFTLGYDGCLLAANELPDVECLYVGPGEHTEAEQAQILQDLIDRQIDGIAVAPTSSPLMKGVLQRARDAGVPVITWDSDLVEADRGLRETYLGSNNYDIGVQIGTVAKERKPDGGTLCLQTGGAEAANHNERLQGIRDTLGGLSGTQPPGEKLSGQNGWTELDECPLVTDDDGALAIEQMSAVMADYPELDVFISTGAFTQWYDEDYREVIAAQADRLATGELLMVMADTLEMQMAQLRDGLSTAQVGQRPLEMGYRAMYILRDLVQGRGIPGDPIYTSLDVCVQSNVDSCIASGDSLIDGAVLVKN
jgi:ribose transport system substrate-binding protein